MTALGMVLLVDVLRVFLPSVITVFGQAADTPAELLGAFALLWFVLPLAVPRFSRSLVPAGALALAGARVALQFTDGGRPQLWIAAAGVLAGLVWLTAVAVRGSGFGGVVIGIALSALVHGALGTVDLAWRGGLWSVVVVVVAAAFLASSAGPPAGPVTGPRAWGVVLPALLLWGAVGGSPSLVTASVAYLAGSGGVASSTAAAGALWVKALVAVSVVLFLGGFALRARRSGAVALVAGCALAVAGPVWLLVPAMLLVAAGLGLCLAAAASGPGGTGPRRGYALAGGGIGMAVAAILHYSAYDLGYDNRPVFVVVAAVIAAVAVRTRRAVREVRGNWVLAGALGLVALLAVDGGRWGDLEREHEGDSLRLVAYNVRMGTGLDGRFDPDRTAAVIAAQRPDVVLLSEVDRGWWLNGGHDGVSVLASRLGMSAWFAPAADAVWGDALLTRLPVVRTRTVPLTADGAPTGAQALSAVLRAGGREVTVVSTHLQPPPGREPVVQAREVAALADGPTIVGGDLNTEPGDPAYQVLLDAGLVDAFAAARPVLTSTADDPTKQIDHVLTTPGFTSSQVTTSGGEASDHLAVAVTLTLS
jgi:endonuclease/exonuclease/phosphatase family metal-dependent hydrolase